MSDNDKRLERKMLREQHQRSAETSLPFINSLRELATMCDNIPDRIKPLIIGHIYANGNSSTLTKELEDAIHALQDAIIPLQEILDIGTVIDEENQN